MSNFTDLKYINVLSSRLLKFRQTGASLWTFRCPLCGDSHKNPNKTRGYIYQRAGEYHFKCQNCGKAYPFFKFLQMVDSELYSEYQMEKFFRPTEAKEEQAIIPKPVFYDSKLFEALPSIASLDDFVQYKRYVLDRLIPEAYWSRMFICDNFKAFTNKVLPGKFRDTSMDETRLLIPFYDEKKKVIAFTGRSFNPKSQLRYININLDESRPKIFGLDRWKKDQPTPVVEGPIDSMFLSNCIASAGGDLVSVIKEYDKSKFTIVYDNEPFSKTTKEKIKKAIENGYKVCIWPNNIKFKDINLMVLKGMKVLDIEKIIRDNTFSGLEAQIKLTFWK